MAVGGGIWVDENMAKIAKAGITHIIDMQIEFNDTPLARPYGIEVCWCPVDDDFQLKPASIFERGTSFAKQALTKPESKVYVHCAAGVHRAPMMALAVLRSLGYPLKDAMKMIQTKRYVVDFADVYVQSVERFMSQDGNGT